MTMPSSSSAQIPSNTGARASPVTRAISAREVCRSRIIWKMCPAENGAFGESSRILAIFVRFTSKIHPKPPATRVVSRLYEQTGLVRADGRAYVGAKMPDRLRAAIAGVGFIGPVHLRAARLAGAEVVGVSGGGPGRAGRARAVRDVP